MKNTDLKTAIKTLRAERTTHATRIEQIDAALAAMDPLLPTRAVKVVKKARKKKRVPKPERQARQVDHPRQPAPTPARVGLAHEAKAIDATKGSDWDASARRVGILDLIRKAGVTGLEGGELKAKTPSLKPGDRQNALQQLKQQGKIRRDGRTWVLASSPTEQPDPDE